MVPLVACLLIAVLLTRGGGQPMDRKGDALSLSSSAAPVLPIIDITPLRDLSLGPGSPFYMQMLHTLRQIDEAMQTFGCFIATGHDLEHKWEPALDAARQLFALPPAALADVAITRTGVFGRGFLEKGRESGVAAKHYELKEGYSYGHPRAPATATNLLEQRNIWPEGLPESTISTFHALFLECLRVGKLVGGALASAPGGHALDPRALLGGDSISLMRVFHYFSAHDVPGAVHAGRGADEAKETEESGASVTAAAESRGRNVTVLGSSPHTDWGFLTVILQDDVGGLQFYSHSAGAWLDVPVVRRGLVINGGDFLRVASGGKFVSPIHRVLSPAAPGAERHSFVFFLYPNYTSAVPQIHNQAVLAQRGSGADLTYNTLEVATTGETAAAKTFSAGGVEKTFGDYIVEKWKGVEVQEEGPVADAA